MLRSFDGAEGWFVAFGFGAASASDGAEKLKDGSATAVEVLRA